MTQRSKTLPVLPLLMAAVVLGIVVGSLGTAVGAPALTKKKVKAIATKIVRKEASTLTVATATTAGNAANLGGQPPATYLSRAAFGSKGDTALAVADTAYEIVGPTTLTVPAGAGFVHVIGSSSFIGGNTNVLLWYQMDAACSSTFTSPGFDFRAQGNTTPDQTSLTQNMVLPITAGLHTFRLCAVAGTASNATASTLSVEVVNVGANG